MFRRLDLLSGLHLLSIHDLLAPAGRHDADTRGIVILRIGIDQYILQLLDRKKLTHGLAEHGFSRPRRPDEHNVPSLAGCLFDHFNGFVLADHLIYEALRYGYAACVLKINIAKQLFRLIFQSQFFGPHIVF